MNLNEYFDQFPFLGPTEISVFKKHIQVKEFDAGESIKPIGQIMLFPAVVLEGFARVFIVSINGVEKSLCIAEEGMHLLDVNIFNFGMSSTEMEIQRITAGKVAFFNHLELDKEEVKYPRMSQHKKIIWV